jgi:hypothetical protein
MMMGSEVGKPQLYCFLFFCLGGERGDWRGNKNKEIKQRMRAF